MKKLYHALLALLLTAPLFSQNNNPWRAVNEMSFAKTSMDRRIVPGRYETFSLDLQALGAILKNAPMRFSIGAGADKARTPVLAIPMPGGKFLDFHFVEAPVMHPELAAKFPEIKTYAGWSEDDPSAYMRFGISPKGFHAMVLSGKHSTVYIDRYAEGETEHYICYFKKDYHRNDPFTCTFDELPENKMANEGGHSSLEKMAGDCKFRVYALALACTGEYAQFHGGTVAAVMAEFNTAMARVNGIFERDVNVTMVMVPNNNNLIFLNAATDPYTNNSGGTMLGQNQTTCDNIIGNANYDIGHVFSTGGGGVAFLNSACNPGSKAGGVTGLGNPTGDPFYVDYVAHEMGHQYGGGHTQNNDCNRANFSAMEPGSASTIMGYAGICAPNVQSNSDDYFHAISLSQMGNHIGGNGGNCADLSPNGNHAPSVSSSGSFFNVPVSTPFVLIADGSDPDPGTLLTYCWEQMDNEVATMPPTPNNTGGPAFRSLLPTVAPERYFPNLTAILANANDTWEVLPAVSREMNFRCTVRDNNGGGGCTGETDVVLDFSSSAGPFLVTQPNTASVVWSSGQFETVTWDVANTNASPVNAAAVDIFLSVDGGITYPHTLAIGTPNDGTQSVSVPNLTSTKARVMVKGSGNVFFDISNENFRIEMNSTPTFTINVTPSAQSACPVGEVQYVFNLLSFVGFNEAVSFAVSGVPAGAVATFLPTSLTPPGFATLTVDGLENVAPGSYTMDVVASSVSITHDLSVELVVLDEINTSVGLSSPADGQTGVPASGIQLEWDDLQYATNYEVEVAYDPGFQTLIYSGNVTASHFNIAGMQESQVYYWRVRGINLCNDGPYSTFFAFQTGGLQCETYNSTDVPKTIPASGGGTTTSNLTVNDDFPIASIYLHADINHTWVGDLLAVVSAPDGTSALLFDRPGDPATSDGCSEDNMLVGFSDAAPNSADDLENTCSTFPPAIAGDFQPVTAFSVFSNKSSSGIWKLAVNDLFPPEDDGTLNSWYLEMCGTVIYPAATLINNNLLTVAQGGSENITEAFLETQGTPALTNYILLALPQNGLLYLQGVPLEVGSSFTQLDINNGSVSYSHDGSMTTMDTFLFDVVDHEFQWLHNQLFQIEILESAISASATLTQAMDCHNANNAIITATAFGGTSPITYSLNGGPAQNSNVFNDLGEGIYEVTIMDADGLIAVSNPVTIENPPIIIVSADVVEDDITVMASGGTGTLQYSINGVDFQNSHLFEGLANGTYTITVMDENGCLQTVQAIVAVNTLTVSASQTQGVKCFNGNDGIITVDAGGGSAPYQYSLNGGPAQSSNIFTNLSPGTYTATVEDMDGFTLSSNIVVLANPPALTLMAMVVDDVVTASGNGGTGTLQYSINGVDFQNSNEFAGLTNGIYTVTVMDGNGCTTTTQATVAVNTLVVSASQTQGIACFGGNDGEITVEVTGGTPAFMYSLDGVNFQSSHIFQNMAAGTYNITVEDANGFLQTVMASVSQPPAITGSASANGYEITVTASGGTGVLQYSLDGGAFQNSNLFYPVAPGSHDVVVMDGNGCEATISTSVNVPALAVGLSVSQIPTCSNSSDGAVTANGQGGIPPYQYSLNGGPFQSSEIFAGLPAGDYVVSIMDSGGFTVASIMQAITGPPAITVSATSVNNEVTVAADGGTGSFLYQLDNGPFQSSNVFAGVPNGSHTVTVQDENGCEKTTAVFVNVPALQIAANVEQEVSCHDGLDGVVSIDAAGGIPPYQYSLDGAVFQNGNSFSGLAPGTYQPTIMDAVGQILAAPDMVIGNPAPVVADGSAFGPVITMGAMGGTGNFTYSFEGMPFQNENTYEVVWNGTYDVVVMDENGCMDTAQVVVNKPEMLLFTVVQASCADSQDGSVYIEGVDGGYSPYQFALNNGPLTSNVEYPGLGTGEYIFLVVDGTGYEWFAQPILIGSPPPILVMNDVVDNNLTVNASGGMGDLSYSIDGGLTYQSDSVFTSLPNGTYEVVVMDENGCTATSTVTVDFTNTNEVDGGLRFEIVPNPSTGIFNLTMESRVPGPVEMTVHNAIGQMVFRSTASSGSSLNEELDLSFLANGHYQLKVVSGELWGVKRLVVVR